MYQLSANIELLFTEAGEDAGDRVRAAAAAGFDAVEMWFSTDKDLDSLAKALADTGVQLTSMIAGPRMGYTFPGTDLAPFHEGLDLAVEHARQLGCPRIVLASGVGFPGMNRQRNLAGDHRHVRRGPRAAPAARASSSSSSRSTPGSTTPARSPTAPRTRSSSPGPIGDDSFGILYDLYHSITQGEDPATELANAAGFVKYVQIADAPGRARARQRRPRLGRPAGRRPGVRLRRPDRARVLPGRRVGEVGRVHPVGRGGRVTPGKIDVLLATGRVTVEHDNEFRSFRHHTTMLTALLESTGRFRVRVLEEFRGIGDELLDRFDVVLVMYEGRDDYHSVAEGFGPTTEQALLRFVRDKGRGIVWFHGSSVQEPDWGWPEEFDRMRGATLSRETGLRPRPQGEVVVRTTEPRHAITEGLDAEWAVVNDDVLTGARMDPSAQVLLTVFDDVESYRRAGWPNAHTPVVIPPGGLEALNGMNTDQPLAWVNEWGAGRSFCVTLGHDWDTFRKVPFMTLLVRGVEWAATGEVTLGPPERTGAARWRVWPYYAGDPSRFDRSASAARH